MLQNKTQTADQSSCKQIGFVHQTGSQKNEW